MFFTADHRFGHAKIIPLCGRPFADVEEMNEAMITRWNHVIGRNDDVWHLGDFAFRGGAQARSTIFSRLNGRKRLILANHDDRSTIALPWVDAPVQIAVAAAAGTRVVLCHYALRVWPGMHRGAIHLYGHSHGSLPGNSLSLSLDVGVDAWDFRPVSIYEVQQRHAMPTSSVFPAARISQLRGRAIGARSEAIFERSHNLGG